MVDLLVNTQLWVPIFPMPGGFTTCMAMFGNGAWTGSVVSPQAQIPRVQHRGRPVWYVAGVGTTTQTTALLRTAATTTIRRSRTTATASASLAPQVCRGF